MSDNFFAGLETCFVNLTANGMNPSFFPVGSAQHLSLDYNILPFLCDLLKAATNDNVSPLLTEPPTPFDITPYTNFSELTGVGDPRVSLGETMTQTYIYFLPRVITQTEVRQAGGSRVIDNFICTADGTPIKESTLIPAVLSLDLSGRRPYQYGAITIPPISATYDELMKIIDPQEVKDFVGQYIKINRARHAREFASFIQTYFGDWSIENVSVYQSTQFLIVTLKRSQNTVYLKYYADVANEVGCFLGQANYKLYLQYQAPDNMAASMAFGSAIPDYKKLIENPDQAREFYNTILNNYKTTPDLNWSNLFTQGNTALAISWRDSFVSLTSSVPQISSIQVFECSNIQ